MSDRISLTASMRSNLLSLQNTQEMFDTTQTRLSTGKKVNSALDNPSSFFTARSLTNRSDDLNSLMDSMGQAVQTLTAADQGIETLTNLVEQAKALVNTARDSATKPTTLTGTVDIGDEAKIGDVGTVGDADIIHVRNGSATKMESEKVFEASDVVGAQPGLDLGDSIQISVGGEVKGTIEIVSDETIADFVAKIDALEDVSAELSKGKITIESTNNGNLDIVNLDGSGSYTTSGDTLSDLGFDEGAYISVASESTIAEFVGSVDTALDSIGISATEVDGHLQLSAENGLDIVVTDVVGTSADALGSMDDGATNGTNERAGYASQFDGLRTQITQLVDDTSYKGINLLKGDDLTVNFNENRTSKLEIEGVTFDAIGLGIDASGNNWEAVSDIEDSLADVESALASLREQATTFGNNLSVVQTREDFTDGMVNTLTTGADKLTLADMNEEAANMLALQTRQSLGTNSLSLASQSAQSVLQLF